MFEEILASHDADDVILMAFMFCARRFALDALHDGERLRQRHDAAVELEVADSQHRIALEITSHSQSSAVSGCCYCCYYYLTMEHSYIGLDGERAKVHRVERRLFSVVRYE